MTTQAESAHPTTKAALLLLSANLILLTALSCGYRPLEPIAFPTGAKQKKMGTPPRRNLRSLTSNNHESSYYYSHFTNHQSQRTLYRTTLLDGSIATVGAQLNTDLSSLSSSEYEWTKETIDCPTHLQSFIPHHFGECFQLVNVASGARLQDSNDGSEGIESVASNDDNTLMANHQIWINEYPLDLQPPKEAGLPDLVTIRNVGSGRRLFATSEGDLSVGFGASSPTSDGPRLDELWEERVRCKYTNVLRR